MLSLSHLEACTQDSQKSGPDNVTEPLPEKCELNKIAIKAQVEGKKLEFYNRLLIASMDRFFYDVSRNLDSKRTRNQDKEEASAEWNDKRTEAQDWRCRRQGINIFIDGKKTHSHFF